MRRSLVFLIVALWSFYATAQKTTIPAGKPVQNAAGNSQPSAAQIMKLLELLDIRQSLQFTMDAMKEQITNEAERGFREKIPQPTAEQLKSVHMIVDDAFRDLVFDDLIKDIVPVYQKHLTQADVNAAIAFYSSPTGRKITREQPAMMRESMAATSEQQQKRMELMLAKLELRMQQFIQSEQSKSAPEKR